MTTLRFDGKVAVITGAGRGIGRQLALFFASRGTKVVVNDLGVQISGKGQSQPIAEEVVKQIVSKGGIAVADGHSVIQGEKIIQAAIKQFGRVDILINNAGVSRPAPFQDITPEDWQSIFRVHVDGAFKCTRAVWNTMREQGYGRIINISSAIGLYGGIDGHCSASFAAAKIAIHGFSQSLAIEGVKKNILTNSVAPLANTRTLGLSDARRDFLGVQKIVPLIAYLCHETCKQNGSMFECGGGWFSKLRWQRAEGVRFDPQKMSPQTVAENFSKISSFEGKNEYPVYMPAWDEKVKGWLSKSKL